MALKWYRPLKWNSNDHSWNGYNGSDSGVTYTSEYGIFNGSALISLPNSAGFSGNQARTILAEVNTTIENNNTGKCFWGNGANWYHQDASLCVYDNNSNPYHTLYLRTYYDDQAHADVGTSYYDWVWRSVAMSYDWSSTWTLDIDSWIRYFNDFSQSPRTNASYNGNVSLNTSQKNVMIWWPGAWFNYFKWKIRNVRVWWEQLPNAVIKNYALLNKWFF